MEACLFLQVLSSLGHASHCVRRPEPPGRRPLLLAPGCPGLWVLPAGPGLFTSTALAPGAGRAKMGEIQVSQAPIFSSIKVLGEEIGCSE